MSLDERGFLSDLSYWIREARARFGRQFALVEGISGLGQRTLAKLDETPDTRQYRMGGAFYLRGLQSLQGAILMAERCMNVEARTLTRGSLESLFYLGAILKDAEFEKEIHKDSVKAMSVLANAHKKLAIEAGAMDTDTESYFAEALSVQDQGVKGLKLIMKEVAGKAGLSAVYESDYRGLSTDAAHPNIYSLSGHMDRDQEHNWTGLRWGPIAQLDQSFAHTLILIAWTGILLIDQMNSIIDDESIRADVKRFFDEYTGLQLQEANRSRF